MRTELIRNGDSPLQFYQHDRMFYRVLRILSLKFEDFFKVLEYRVGLKPFCVAQYSVNLGFSANFVKI